MTNESFQSWLAGLDRLTEAQWSQLTQAVQERSEGAAAVAATELQIDAERQDVQCLERHGAVWIASQAALAGIGALVGGAGIGARIGEALRGGGHDSLPLAASLHGAGGPVTGAAGRAGGSGRNVCPA